MSSLLGLGPLNCIYFAFVALGVIYALFVLVAGGLHALDLPFGDFLSDLGGDGPSFDHGEVGVTGISSAAIATFITAFGAFGIIATQLFDVPAKFSILWAIIGGVICGGIAQLAFGYLIMKPQGSTEVTLKDVLGVAAEVITPIPADSLGEIVYVAQGGRVTSSAKSVTGEAIGRGEIVIVESIVSNVALVRIKKPTD